MEVEDGSFVDTYRLEYPDHIHGGDRQTDRKTQCVIDEASDRETTDITIHLLDQGKAMDTYQAGTTTDLLIGLRTRCTCNISLSFFLDIYPGVFSLLY